MWTRTLGWSLDLARERLRGGQVAWGFPGDLPVLGAQRALSVPDPQRAQATRTAVGTTPRTPSTRASGSPLGAPTLPGPTGPQAATAGHVRTPQPTRGARTAGMCGARALRPRPTIGSATTATGGGGGVGRAKVAKKATPPPTVDDGWDNQDW